MLCGQGLHGLTMKRSSGDWNGNPLQERERPPMNLRKYASIGARVTVIANGPTNANSFTLVFKVVVKGSKDQEEKEPAKEKAEVKEKAREKENREDLAIETIKGQR